MPSQSAPVTPQSIDAAKAARDQERAQVYAKTGLRIVDAPAVIVHCRQVGCPYVSSAMTEGRAIRSLCAHIVAAHMTKEGAGQ